MAQRQNPPPIGGPARGAAREDRFDAMLEERFSPQHRGAMARQLADHDRSGPARVALPQLGVRPVRAVGPVPERVQQVLTQWVPLLIAHAATHGLSVRELSLDIDAYERAAYEQAHGKLAPGLKLPASSYGYFPVYKRYGIHLVLPDGLSSMEGMFTLFRAFLARLFGDIYLREEVFTLETYREDVLPAAAEITVGMAEKLLLLEESPLTTPELDAALSAHGQQMGMNAKRQPGPVRKGFFQHLRKLLADAGDNAQLPPATTAVIDAAFAQYVARLQKDVPAAVKEMVEATEKLNAQTTFLPPDETPEYLTLREENPAHYLRAAKARLQFVLEAMGAVLEMVGTLEQDAAALTSVEEERVHSHLAELEAQHLARPYLLPGVRLSPEMERRKAEFPLEVHTVMTRLPPQADPAARFKSLSQRMENSAYQRIYHAFMLLRHGIRGAAQGKKFSEGEHWTQLKGLAANFRFRRPLLEAHFARMGVVLDVAEAAAQAESKRAARFPVDPFGRAWGQFIAHALLVDFLVGRRQAGFDPARYWQTVERSLEGQATAVVPRLVLLLRHLQRRMGKQGISAVVSLVRAPSGTLRFTLNQALEFDPKAGGLLAQVERWVDAIVRVREGRLRNEILATGAGQASSSR